MATWLPADPTPIQFALLAYEMVASFIRTTIKAIAHDVVRFTATLSGIYKAARALLRAHEGDAFRATMGTQQAPIVLSIARAVRMRPPVLRATS